jgi:hypothetical protein
MSFNFFSLQLLDKTFSFNNSRQSILQISINHPPQKLSVPLQKSQEEYHL